MIAGIGLAVVVTARPLSGQIVTTSRPVATAVRVDAALGIDGRFDEPSWRQASPIGPLLQREPLEEVAASEETEVRVLYNANALYIGLLCRDRSPGDIVATQLTRDADLDVDDYVTIILDPFFDQRSGFFFQVNSVGARADGQTSNNAEHMSLDWDGIWDAAARTTSEGWQAEIVIPFDTLRFKPGQTVWGLNVERQIKRRNEIDRWAAPRRNIWISNLAEAGRLEGLQEVHQGLGLDLRPYVSGGSSDGSRTSAAGLDIVKNLTPNLNASVTVNTDFGETEVDSRQLNLTRFPLFFPEKRAFFLEGAGVFDFAGSFGRELLPFFSRRIGLVQNAAGDNVTVPILVGTKLTGRQSGFNIGVLDVVTKPVSDASVEGGLLPRRNLFVARVSRNLFEQSSIGAIVTNGNPVGTASNTLVGADATFATSTFHDDKNLALQLFALRTDDAASGTRDGAAGFRVDYPNDLWDMSVGWKQIGSHFEPAMGFVPRRGTRATNAGLMFQPRPERRGIRRIFFVIRTDIYTDLQNRAENWNLDTTWFGIQGQSGDRFQLNYYPEFERLPEPFEIADGIVLPPGSYRWSRFRLFADSATKRPWVVDGSWSWGTFYTGTRREMNVRMTLKPSAHFSVTASADRNDIRLAQGSFVSQLFSLRGECNFTPNLSWTNLAQYDSESRVLGLQSRFRWILRPGNDLFFVLNRGWYRTFDGAYQSGFDRGSVKFQYTFRL